MPGIFWIFLDLIAQLIARNVASMGIALNRELVLASTDTMVQRAINVLF